MPVLKRIAGCNAKTRLWTSPGKVIPTLTLLPLGKESINIYLNYSFLNLHPDNYNFGPISLCVIKHVHSHSQIFSGPCFCRCTSLEAKLMPQSLMWSLWHSWDLCCCLQMRKQYFGKFSLLCCFWGFLGLFPAHNNVSVSPSLKSAPGTEFSYDIYTPSFRFVMKVAIKTVFSCSSVSASLPARSAQYLLIFQHSPALWGFGHL